MSSDRDIAVSVRELSKSYAIARNQEKHITLAETALAWAKNPFRQSQIEMFWALRDVSFDIPTGEVVGVIGRNGAGKSTLLKLLSRITEPTSGEIDLYGRVGSLLEVGTGFHPELSGRENVYLNGAILGMRRKEIDANFDSIVDFAGVQRFLDTPVKRYSSGMYIRLAFAVAANLSSEILIVDEVLAVGDADFQKKCLAKIRQVATGGRTVLFVSHNMTTIREVCTRGLVLHEGRVRRYGTVSEAVDEYLSVSAPPAGDVHNISRYGLELCGAVLRHRLGGHETTAPVLNDDYEMVIRLKAHQPLEHCAFVLHIRDHAGTLVSTICSVEEGLGSVLLAGEHEALFNLPHLQLLPGRYRVDLTVHKLYTRVRYLEQGGLLQFEMQTAAVNGAPYGYTANHGFVRIADGASVVDVRECVSTAPSANAL
jgi:lipopolysaccharide transport system ATP-binding protein